MTDSGMRTKALVELRDISPSITELAGLPVPPMCPETKKKDLLACVEGSSVAPLLQDPNKDGRRLLFHSSPDDTMVLWKSLVILSLIQRMKKL